MIQYMEYNLVNGRKLNINQKNGSISDKFGNVFATID